MESTPYSPSYWADYGIAALMLFFVGSAAVYVLREWWFTYKPHYIAMKEAETEKEQNAAKLFAKLQESEGVKARILESLSENQTSHAEACIATHGLVKDIHTKVVLGK